MIYVGLVLILFIYFVCEVILIVEILLLFELDKGFDIYVESISELNK